MIWRETLERRALLGGKKGRSAAKRLRAMGPAPEYGPLTPLAGLFQAEMDGAIAHMRRTLGIFGFTPRRPRHKHRYRNKQRLA